jgi:mRNA-degrading endonuclease RelE of RelBE toxin-antitoxin system
MNAVVSDEVRQFLRTLAPEPRKAVSLAIDRIEAGSAKMEALQEPLQRFYKVKAGDFRLLCAVDANTTFVLFVERRSVVYEIATADFLHKLFDNIRN